MKICIVEKDLEFNKLLKLWFSMRSYEIETYLSIEEAYHQFSNRGFQDLPQYILQGSQSWDPLSQMNHDEIELKLLEENISLINFVDRIEDNTCFKKNAPRFRKSDFTFTELEEAIHKYRNVNSSNESCLQYV